MFSMLETKEQDRTELSPALNSVERILQEVTQLYPDLDRQKQNQLALLLKSVADSPTALQLIRPTEPSAWQVTKEVCEKYLVFVNGTKIPAQELEALNQKAAKLSNDHKKPKYEQIIGLYSQAIKKHSSSALLYLFRAQFSLYAYSIPEMDIKADLDIATRLYECKLDGEPDFLRVFSKTYRNVLLFNSNIEASMDKQIQYLSYLKTDAEKFAAEREFLATIKFLIEKVRAKKVDYAFKLDNFVRKHYQAKPEFKDIVDDIHRQVQIDKKSQATQQTAQLKDSLLTHNVKLSELDDFLKQTFPIQQEQPEEKVSSVEDKKAQHRQKQIEENAKLKALQQEEDKRNEQLRLEEEQKERALVAAEIKAKKEKKKKEKEERRSKAEKSKTEKTTIEENRKKRESEKSALQIKKKEEKKARQLARKALLESASPTTTAIILTSLESIETLQQHIEIVTSSSEVEEKAVELHPSSSKINLLQPVPVRPPSVNIAQVEENINLLEAQENVVEVGVNAGQNPNYVGFDNTAYLLQSYQQMNVQLQLQQANYLMQLQLANQYYQQQLAQAGMMGYLQPTSYATNPNGFQYRQTNRSRHNSQQSQNNMGNTLRPNFY